MQGAAGEEGGRDNLRNWRQRRRRKATGEGWNLHVFDGDWRHHLHKQWGGGWQHLLHDECVCEGCPHTTRWHFESSSWPGRARPHTHTHTCSWRFHFTFSSPMSCKVCSRWGEEETWGHFVREVYASFVSQYTHTLSAVRTGRTDIETKRSKGSLLFYLLSHFFSPFLSFIPKCHNWRWHFYSPWAFHGTICLPAWR